MNNRPRFSSFVYFYLVTFFLLLSFLPVAIVRAIAKTSVRPGYSLASLAWPVVVAFLWLYAQKRCSADRLRFGDGLLWTTRSMMTGWLWMSFFTVIPGLLVVFWGSVGIALYGDVTRKPGFAHAKFHGLVSYFFRNRMRQ